MTFNELFDVLDYDKDGLLCRSDIHKTARELEWSWQESPIYAILDLFSLTGPISKSDFISYMIQIYNDPLGPFGDVLLNSQCHLFNKQSDWKKKSLLSRISTAHIPKRVESIDIVTDDYQKETYTADNDADKCYSEQLNRKLNEMRDPGLTMNSRNTAILIIDPQYSFTKGAWARSIGPNYEQEVKPIQLAFDNCARFLQLYYKHTDCMFTRCPFPPDSYDWDEKVKKQIPNDQPYFIKPGNSVLFPPTNGFKEWIDFILEHGKKNLLIAGCTFNSCVRVSSIETQSLYKNNNLQVVVDLKMCGARASNYMPTPLFDGKSAVENAIDQMINAGIKII